MTLLYTQGFEGFCDVAAIPGAGDITLLQGSFNYPDDTLTAEVGLIAGRNGNGIAGFFADATSLGAGFWGHLIPVAGLSSQDDWVVGLAFYNAHPWYETSGTARSPIIQFIDSDAEVMLSVYPAAGTLNVRAGAVNTGTKLGFADAILPSRVWYYIECKVNFHASTGSVVLRVNEEEVLNVTGVNTTPTTSLDARPSMISIGGGSRSQQFQVDDVYILDDQGSVNNDFLGDIRIERLNPVTPSGNSSGFVGQDADSTDNFEMVDDAAPDDDGTTYVESKTVTPTPAKDTYNFANSSITAASVAAVSVKSLVRKTDAGSRNFVHVARQTGETDSAIVYPGVDYRYMESIFEQDPNDGVTPIAWTTTTVNSAEFGYKVNA